MYVSRKPFSSSRSFKLGVLEYAEVLYIPLVASSNGNSVQHMEKKNVLNQHWPKPNKIISQVDPAALTWRQWLMTFIIKKTSFFVQ